MALHTGYSSKKSSSSTVDLTDLNKKVKDLETKLVTADNTAIFGKSKALEVEQDVATNKTTITTHGNYIQTNKTNIQEALTKANNNKSEIDKLKKYFNYEFALYYVNLTYDTWHSPNWIKAGYPVPWCFFDTASDTTKVRITGHLFDGDTT